VKIGLMDKNLSTIERRKIKELLLRKSENIGDDLEQMWYLMDLVWIDYGCDNKCLNWDKISNFYSDPVWLLNGLFIEQHSISMGHRHAISDWIVNNKFVNVVDYGGGFGTLARLVAKKKSNIKMDIYEPHPSEFGLKRAGEYKNIKIIEKLNLNYDCLMSTDVLEHVPDPLKDLSKMIRSVKMGGHLIIANAFYPMIECHLPQNFHFRYTFNLFARIMGLEVVGPLNGSHATIFKKVNNQKISWKKLRFYESLSIVIYPFFRVLRWPARLIQKLNF
jgi:2-polyprenyl-3-methyl-5-hydroxy-6-metoxy-1,4-benzoquinol methylase